MATVGVKGLTHYINKSQFIGEWVLTFIQRSWRCCRNWLASEGRHCTTRVHTGAWIERTVTWQRGRTGGNRREVGLLHRWRVDCWLHHVVSGILQHTTTNRPTHYITH